MPKRAVEFFVLDVLLSIDAIKRYSKQLKLPEDLLSQEMVSNAILRQLSVLGEAMNHVITSKKLQALIRPHWRRVVDFRNIVIHEYFGLDCDEVFRIIIIKVPELEREFLGFFKHFKNNKQMVLALKNARLELENMGRPESLKYLAKIEKILK